MRYFKWLLLAVVLQVNAQEVDSNVAALEKGKIATDAMMESSVVRETLQGSEVNFESHSSADNTVITDRKESIKKAAQQIANDTTQTDSVLWQEISNASQNLPQMTEQKNTRYGDNIDVFVLVSLSMPLRSLETLVAEIQYEYSDKNVIIVFQGYDTSNPNETMYQISQFAPEKNVNNLGIVVDPTFFIQLEVTEVPYFAIKDASGNWKRVLGDITLTEAFSESESQYDEFRAVGRTYPISEPNLITYIHKKIEETDWNTQIHNATQKVLDRQTSVDLLPANSSYTYLVDGSSTIERDIVYEDKLFVPAGTVVNPLDEIVFSKKYAFLDIASASQLDILRVWKAKNNNLKVITTRMLEPSRMQLLSQEFGEIHQLDPLLSRRFGLEYVPSLVSQKGSKLQVEVVQHDLKLAQVTERESE